MWEETVKHSNISVQIFMDLARVTEDFVNNCISTNTLSHLQVSDSLSSNSIIILSKLAPRLQSLDFDDIILDVPP